MNTDSLINLERRLQEAGENFPFPPTPDIAGRVARRLEAAPPRPRARRVRLGWALALILVVLAGLLAVPPVRAGLLEFLQFGAVRLLFGQPTPSPTPLTGTPVPTPTSLPSLLSLAGRTTLEEAQEQAGFTLRLPSYPADLGLPNYVFLQDMGDPVAIFVWTEPGQPDKIRLSLHQFGPNTFAAEKVNPNVLEVTEVHGQPALWTTGPYLLLLRSGDYDIRRLIEGHVLIWVEDEITYRLETDLTLEEAIRIAESLEPVP